MTISIRDCLHSYAAGLQKTWQHDRLSTVGSSEVGQCLRKTWFAKNETPHDPGYVDRFGAKLRGDLIEQHYWVVGLRASLPEHMRLLFAGEAQRTLVDGYLSATPDGLLVDAVAEECIYLECKSIDPRADLKVEKPEHSFQTQAGMGLVRHATPYRPDKALISYIDASFLDEVTEFTVAFDPAIYQAAKDRARLVMTTEHALGLPPEGKMAGGSECEWCGWKSHCAAVTVAGVPKEETKPLGDNAMTHFSRLRDIERDLARKQEMVEGEHAKVREQIKESLRTHGVRRVKGDSWSISYASIKGRETVDIAAAEAAGLDLSPFRKTGDPSERLTIK